MAQQSQKSQEKLLSLLIHDRDLFEDFIQNKNALSIFDKKYATLVKGMLHALTNSVSLTRDSYKGFVNKESGGKHVAALAEDAIFVQIAMMTDVDKNDYPYLIETVQEDYIKGKTSTFFESFKTEKDKDYKKALRDLSSNIDSILSEGAGNKYKYFTIKSYFDDWYQNLVEKRNNPQKRLLTGIKEIDESMQTGLTPGQLTLFVAEPGGMKSMIMMNIALNVFMDFGEPVLFVSLEMTKDKVMNRIISRETNIDLQKLSKPELLTEDELVKVLQSKEKWEPKISDFGLIDNEERMTVGEIKRFIEKNQAVSNFKLVVIDYIAILQPDERYSRQSEHSWAGEMCKDLRQLGRKHGFALVSAVQLGKESLKRLKQQKQGKQSAGVEDMRGSHDYSADADNIYIQWPHPNEPTQKLCLVCAKARDGKKTFINDVTMAVLDIKPNLQKICTDNVAKWKVSESDPINDVMYQKFGAKPPKIQDLDDLGDAPDIKPMSMSKKIKTSGETSTAFLDI
jgi:replicative DNA helicase